MENPETIGDVRDNAGSHGNKILKFPSMGYLERQDVLLKPSGLKFACIGC